jgi:hypothetical protein
MRHGLMEETPTKVLEWMERCAGVQPNLAAALGWFGEAKREVAERAGHYRLRRQFSSRRWRPRRTEDSAWTRCRHGHAWDWAPNKYRGHV